MTVLAVDRDPVALTLTIVSEFDAPAARVWQVWADPRQLERWWGPPSYPATVVDHDLIPGGRVTYYMTGPDDEKYHGWWRVIAVDPPHSLEIEDGFADDSGRPNDDLPTTSIEVRLTAATATRSRALSRRRARRSRRPARRWLTRRRSRLTPEEARRAFPPRRKLTDEQAREVTRLYAETDTPVEAIARQFSIGQASVYRLAQQQ